MMEIFQVDIRLLTFHFNKNINKGNNAGSLFFAFV